MATLEGQYIPTNNDMGRNSDVILIGEKPSDYFLKHPHMQHYGNYNNPKSPSDMRLQEFVRKYLGQVFITDMVKDEGVSGADFEKEWVKEPRHRERLLDELRRLKPKKIGALGRKVEKLLKHEFPEYKIVYIIHPSGTRYPKNRAKWPEQFEQLRKGK